MVGNMFDTRCVEVNKFIFPVALILLDLGAAFMYGLNGDVRKVIYWVAAAILNITVTF